MFLYYPPTSCGNEIIGSYENATGVEIAKFFMLEEVGLEESLPYFHRKSAGLFVQRLFENIMFNDIAGHDYFRNMVYSMVLNLLLLEINAANAVNTIPVIYVGGETPKRILENIMIDNPLLFTKETIVTALGYSYDKCKYGEKAFIVLFGIHPSHHLLTGRRLADVLNFQSHMVVLQALRAMVSEFVDDDNLDQCIFKINTALFLERQKVISLLQSNEINIDMLKEFRKSALYYISCESIENALKFVREGQFNKNSKIFFYILCCVGSLSYIQDFNSEKWERVKQRIVQVPEQALHTDGCLSCMTKSTTVEWLRVRLSHTNTTPLMSLVTICEPLGENCANAS